MYSSGHNDSENVWFDIAETSSSRVIVKKVKKSHFLLFLALQGSNFEKLSKFYKIVVKLFGVKQEFRSEIV